MAALRRSPEFMRYFRAKTEALLAGVPPSVVVDIEDAVLRRELSLEEAAARLRELAERARRGV